MGAPHAPSFVEPPFLLGRRLEEQVGEVGAPPRHVLKGKQTLTRPPASLIYQSRADAGARSDEIRPSPLHAPRLRPTEH